ncbi:hypothetical protein [Rubrolithibacter danxiaensis]|uniref:hypothetical protein n=1 Tax=Rubrolithibacter danxiaensis TaxID=3390805 RepID=UPI003BF85A49
MVRTSTPASNAPESIQKDGSMESISEEDEQFLSSIKEDLNKLVKQPHGDTITSILNYSKRLRLKRI